MRIRFINGEIDVVMFSREKKQFDEVAKVCDFLGRQDTHFAVFAKGAATELRSLLAALDGTPKAKPQGAK